MTHNTSPAGVPPYSPDLITKRVESMLDRFERMILRRIFGPIVDNGVWRIRRNEELYDDLPLTIVIRIKRLQCAGHVIRMEGERGFEERY